ncbi:hypothetical protein EON67_08950, partial [archaeon]
VAPQAAARDCTHADKSAFGQRMLARMGWSEGKGLGKHEDGMLTHVKVKKRAESQGLCSHQPANHALAFASHAVRTSRMTAHMCMNENARACVCVCVCVYAALGADTDVTGNVSLLSAVKDFNSLLKDLHATTGAILCTVHVLLLLHCESMVVLGCHSHLANACGVLPRALCPLQQAWLPALCAPLRVPPATAVMIVTAMHRLRLRLRVRLLSAITRMKST